MKPFSYIASCLLTLMFVWGNPQYSFAEKPMMRVFFVNSSIATDYQTGERIHYLDRCLYSLPDTTFIGDFYGVRDNDKYALGRMIDANVGTQFIISVGTMDCQRHQYHDEEQRKSFEESVKKQGKHETVWFGPYTIPDTVNTDYGVVKIIIPEVRLTRVK